MARIRNTARWGNSDVIMLKPYDKIDLGIEVGEDEVDIDDIQILKKKKKK